MSNKKARGKRAKTRRKLKGKGSRATVNILLGRFDRGSVVQVDIRPELHSGMPDAIYQGSVGVVVGEQGKLCRVDVHKGNLAKQVLVHPGHLRKAAGEKK